MKNTKIEKIIGGVVAWSFFIIVISLVVRACNNDIREEEKAKAEHLKNVPHTYITNCFGVVFQIHASDYAEVKSAMDRQKIEEEAFEKAKQDRLSRKHNPNVVGELVGAAVVTKLFGLW